MNIRPSSLPFLSACPCWQSDGGNTETDAGTKRHQALKRLLTPDGIHVPDSSLDLPDADRDGVVWAADYIRCKAPMSEYPLTVETRGYFIDRDFQRIEGTPDVICGSHLFDLKWRERDYTAQMAAYALMMWEATPGIETITAHVLYGESKHFEVLTFDRESAEAIVQEVIDRANAADAQPTPCDYCGWCGKREECPALVKRVNAVVSGREDWELEQYHTSAIISAAEMGKALRLARHIADWCESVEHHAKELAVKSGLVPEGFKLQTRQGNRFIANIAECFARAGLPQDTFLSACEVKLSALVEKAAYITGAPKAATERDLEAKLGDVVQRKPSTVSLVAIKQKKA